MLLQNKLTFFVNPNEITRCITVLCYFKDKQHNNNTTRQIRSTPGVRLRTESIPRLHQRSAWPSHINITTLCRWHYRLPRYHQRCRHHHTTEWPWRPARMGSKVGHVVPPWQMRRTCPQQKERSSKNQLHPTWQTTQTSQLNHHTWSNLSRQLWVPGAYQHHCY